MGKNYHLYDPFRVYELTEEEAALSEEVNSPGYQKPYLAQQLERAAIQRSRQDGAPRERSAVQQNELYFHTILAKRRAEEQLGSVILPENSDASLLCPDVDPRGNYCGVDMEFTQRIQAIRARLATRPADIQHYVNLTLSDIREPMTTHFPDIIDPMKDACRHIRICERAAKLALTEESSDRLLEEVQALEQCTAVRQFDAVLTVLEQVAGTKPGDPSPATKKFLGSAGFPVPDAVLNARRQPDILPREVVVPFTNLESQLALNFYSNPRHWGQPIPKKFEGTVNEKLMDDILDRYACATVNTNIDSLFQPGEQRFGSPAPDSMNRGTLIMVDGKTVEERMHDQYAKDHGGSLDGYADWYRQNCPRMTNEYVSAGLMAGRRVEACLPDSSGKISPTPISLSKTGYTPKLEPVILSSWERHLSKLGFFKEKVAKAQEYQRIVECRERTLAKAQLSEGRKLYDPEGSSLRQQYFGSSFPAYRKESTAYPDIRTGSAAVSFCALALVGKGHSLQDVLDPAKLQAEKQAMGAEFSRHYAENDVTWFNRSLANGHQKMFIQLNKWGEEHDLTDLSHLRENCGFYQGMARILQDSADAVRIDPKAFNKGRNACFPLVAWSADVYTRSVAGYLKVMTDAFHVQHEFGRDPAAVNRQLSTLLAAKALNSSAREYRKTDPDAKLMDILGETPGALGVADSVSRVPSVQILSQMLSKDPELLTETTSIIQKDGIGKLVKSMSADAGEKGCTAEVEFEGKLQKKISTIFKAQMKAQRSKTINRDLEFKPGGRGM